jgi:hypothetical protein
MRSHLITISCGFSECINRHSMKRWLRVCQWNRLRRVHQEHNLFLPHDGKILWAYSVRLHPMLQHVTRSRIWNIMERVNGDVSNKIKLGMMILTIKYRRNKGIGHRRLRFNDESPSWMHMDHYGHLGPPDDHSPERSLDDVWSIPKPHGNTLKGSIMCKLVLVHSELSEYWQERDGKVLRWSESSSEGSRSVSE